MELADYKKMLDLFMLDDNVDGKEAEFLKLWLRQNEFDWQDLAALRNATIDHFMQKLEAGPDQFSKRHACNALRSLGKITTTLWKYGMEKCSSCNPHSTTAFFAPKDNLGNVVIENLEKARKSILIAVYTITDDAITDTLSRINKKCEESDNTLEIRILTDDEKIDDPGSDIRKLAKCSKISIRKDSSSSLMHHKFALIDRKLLLNGSFNWTRNAKYHNFENLSVTANPVIVQMFINEFESIWQHCSPY